MDKVRRASIKETGEELSQREWQRFDAAVEQVKRDKRCHEGDLILSAPADGGTQHTHGAEVARGG